MEDVAELYKGVPSSPSESIRAVGTDDFISEERIADQLAQLPEKLPKPVGYRILVLALTLPDTVGDAGIMLSEADREAQAVASPQGIVLKVGDGAYIPGSPTDQRFDKTGPWCKVGDRVLFKKYAGMTYQLANRQRLFILNDDDVGCVIDSGHLEGTDNG